MFPNNSEKGEDNEVVEHTNYFSGFFPTQNKSSFQRRLGPCLDKRCKPIDEKLIFFFLFSFGLFFTLASGTVKKHEREKD